MKQSLHIMLAIVLAAMCVIPVSGQSFRRHKVKTEPEKLVISRMYSIPGKSRRDISHLLYNWDGTIPEVGDKTMHFGYDNIISTNSYVGRFNNLDLGPKNGNLIVMVDIVIGSGCAQLVFRDIDVDCGYVIYPGPLTESDDSFNRTSLWLIRHKKVFAQARLRAQECFEYVASSLESYINDNGPLDLVRIR